MEIKLNLELLNQIMAYLAKRPFDEVEYFFTNIRAQVAPQIPAPEEAAETEVPTE